jgi:hypothetical protein
MPASPLPPKARRTALAALSRDTLTAVTSAYDLDVGDRRVVGNHIDAIVRSRTIEFADLLSRLSRDELKTVCSTLDLPSDGREKQVLIDRILGSSNAPTAVSTAAPSPKTNGKPAHTSDRPPTAPGANASTKRNSMSDPNLSSFIWSVADLLRGDLQAVGVRQGHLAVHRAAPPRLRAGVHQGRSARGVGDTQEDRGEPRAVLAA